MRSALYTGTLVHARRVPREHVFRYRVAFCVLDLDELGTLDERLRLLSVDRPNLVSFRSTDHPIGDPGRPLKERVAAFAGRNGIDLDGGTVLLLTNLRVLGYVFNPVSFYWCYGRDGALACVVAEVRNTFGEMHPYLLGPAQRLPDGGGALAFEHEKRLHVSPFFELDQTYRFVLGEPAERVFARVDVYEGGERRFGSVLAGERRELTDGALAATLVRYPLMPQKVIAAIHWQALRLYLKRVPFHHKPPFEPGRGSVAPRERVRR